MSADATESELSEYLMAPEREALFGQFCDRITEARNKTREAEIWQDLASYVIKDAFLSIRWALVRELRQCTFLDPDVADDVEAAVIEDFSEPILESRPGDNDGIGDQIVRRLAGAFTDPPPLDQSGRISLLRMLTSSGVLSMLMAERLIDELLAIWTPRLRAQNDLADDLVLYLTNSAKRYLIDRILEATPDSMIEDYLNRLRDKGLLTSDVLLQMARNRNPRAFLVATAVVAEMPVELVEAFLADGGVVSMKRLLAKAGYSDSIIQMLENEYADKLAELAKLGDACLSG